MIKESAEIPEYLKLMDKKEKESWIINQFIKLYAAKTKYLFLNIEKVPENKASGPDFIVKYDSGASVGVEVTELLDHPSSQKGQQRVIQKKFLELLNDSIDKRKFDDYFFSFYNTEYPKNDKMLNEYTKKVIGIINDVNLSEVREKKRKSFYVDKQKFTIFAGKEKTGRNKFIPFTYGESGIKDIDSENWFTALKLRIEEKQKKAKNYLATQPNILVIYDNSDYGIFLNDIKQKITNNLSGISANRFKEVWLLESNSIFRAL